MASLTLNQYELDSLYSVLNASIVDRARSALSSLLDEQISHEIKSTHKQISTMGDTEKLSGDLVLCSIFLRGEGDVRFGILYTIPEQDAKKIVAKLLCVEKLDLLDDVGKSALSEVGNIMSGSFFNAVSDTTGLRVELSIPYFAMTSGKTILEPHAAEFVKTDNDMITRVELYSKSSGINVHMLIIQDHDNARKLLNSKKHTSNTNAFQYS